MKKLIPAVLAALSVVGICQAQSSNLPYTASYSSNFTIGDPGFAEKVMMLWKDYENNSLDNHADLFADSLIITLADGHSVQGKAQNLAGVKQFRSSLTDFKAHVDAWVSLKSMDREQNVVCVWGGGNYTDRDGKRVTTRVHEVWVFNKDGKVAFMTQFSGQNGM
jgi:ketosteroid isomerase-like protein